MNDVARRTVPGNVGADVSNTTRSFSTFRCSDSLTDRSRQCRQQSSSIDSRRGGGPGGLHEMHLDIAYVSVDRERLIASGTWPGLITMTCRGLASDGLSSCLREFDSF